MFGFWVGMWHVSFSAAKRLIQAVVREICVKTFSEVIIIILVRFGELMSALFDFCYRSILTFFDDSEDFSTKVEQAIIKCFHIFQTDRILLKRQFSVFVLFFLQNICSICAPHPHVAPHI